MHTLIYTATKTHNSAPCTPLAGFTIRAYVRRATDGGYEVHSVHRFDSGSWLASDAVTLTSETEARNLADELVSS